MPTDLHYTRDMKNQEEFVELLGKQTRSAMHSILGMLQLISDSPLNESQQDYMQTCRMAADNLLRTVDDISGAAWQPELEDETRTILDLRAFLGKVEGVFRLAAETNGRRFEWTMHPEVPERVLVNEALVERFLIRLIGRALEVCGPIMAVNIELGTLPDTSAGNDQIAMITVRLSCTGLENPGATLEDVLGLAITRKMAGWLGAEVETAGLADGPWHVISRIPMRLASPLPAVSKDLDANIEQVPRPKTVGNMRILVADDSDEAYFLVETYLKANQCTLVRAQDGYEAVEKAINGSFDLILMDIDMPGCTGYEATRRIRLEETLRGSRRTPVVVLSAESLQDQMHVGSRVGCSGYLTKPVTRKVLVRVLERYLPALN